MEEDDDNFLAEVIDFGDGRQYTVQQTSDDSRTVPTERPSEVDGDRGTDPTGAPSPPVRKEDRFRDDFDRSWPPSKPHPPVSSDTGPNGQSPLSPNGPSKALFNERSNRLEPYSGRQNSHPGRRGNRDAQSPIEPRTGRDLPPHTPHLLHKQEPISQRQRRPGNMEPPKLDTSVTRDGKSGWREGHSPSSSIASSHPSSIVHGHSRRWSRDEGPGRRPSMSNGPPPPRDLTRPPQSLTMSPSSPSRSPLLLREERQPQIHSPSLSVRSLSSSAHPVMSPAIDDEEVRQAAMHNAAERARIRRQQEEQEREKEKERARKKAEELAAKIEAQKAEASASQVKKNIFSAEWMLMSCIRCPQRQLRRSPNLRGEGHLLSVVPPGMKHPPARRFRYDNNPPRIPSHRNRTLGECMRLRCPHHRPQLLPNTNYSPPTTTWTPCQ